MLQVSVDNGAGFSEVASNVVHLTEDFAVGFQWGMLPYDASESTLYYLTDSTSDVCLDKIDDVTIPTEAQAVQCDVSAFSISNQFITVAARNIFLVSFNRGRFIPVNVPAGETGISRNPNLVAEVNGEVFLAVNHRAFNSNTSRYEGQVSFRDQLAFYIVLQLLVSGLGCCAH